MDLGLNIASAGMLAEQVQEDQISNDLANASTPGFKASSSAQQSFGAMLLQNTADGADDRLDRPRRRGQQEHRPISAQGPMEPTGQPLDFAIAGTGFFAVRTASGVQYTRNGQFSVEQQGPLVDQYGDDVLSQNGSPIKVGASRHGADDGARAVQRQQPLAARQQQLLRQPSRAAAPPAQIYAGQLEGSGIDAIQAMVKMERR